MATKKPKVESISISQELLGIQAELLEQKDINAQLYALFSDGLGISDKGELRDKINKVHARVTPLEENVSSLNAQVTGLYAIAMISVVVITGLIFYVLL